MSSVVSKSFKQTNGYFVAVAPILSTSQFSVSVPATGAGGDAKPPTFVKVGTANAANFAAGAMLKDLGKTVVSSTHTFRKVQAVVVGGPSITATTPLTGLPFYIELTTGQSAQAGVLTDTGAAPVAYLPGLF